MRDRPKLLSAAEVINRLQHKQVEASLTSSAVRLASTEVSANDLDGVSLHR
jgi:hypothetical protein